MEIITKTQANKKNMLVKINANNNLNPKAILFTTKIARRLVHAISRKQKLQLSSIILITLFAISSFGVATEADFPTTCTSCNDSKVKTQHLEISVKDQAKGIATILDGPLECKNHTSKDCLLIEWLRAKHDEYPVKCREFFIDKQGFLGAYSKRVSKLILEDIDKAGEDSPFLKASDDFEKYCPGFNSFDVKQKIAFHVWIFELTAFPESSCNVKTRSNPNAPTTPAVCMYQLESSPSARKWRSNGFSPKRCAVSYKEILTMEGCTGCAFDEYKRKILKDGTPFGVFSSDGKPISRSYWASQNPLPQQHLECMKMNKGVKNKKHRFAYLKNCKKWGANKEWEVRDKFFRRLPRFPLCKTSEAEYEINQLHHHQ